VDRDRIFFPKVSVREAWITLLLSAGYLLLSRWLIGSKPEQVGLVLIFLGCFYISRPSRHFVLAFSVFIVFWILFDYMKAFPNYQYNTVHIGDLYQADKRLFGWNGLSVNEFWKQHQHVFLDIFSGFAYLCWMPVPLGFGVYLFIKKRNAFLPFALTFLFVNLLGFVVYYTYPAAPPWYVQQYGFVFHLHTPGNTAGLARWDNFFHVHVFEGLYAKSSNVFAAMPSLHAAYPLVTLYHGLRNKVPMLLSLFLALVVAGIWFAAVYTSHHYVLDVIGGITCAGVGIFIFQRWLMKTGWFQQFIARYNKMIGA
jgi:hypothetical protein